MTRATSARRDTTLGADDGYGVAYMLAVMEEDFPHPPLELVFTVQEENGCNGVDALDAGKLKSRRMIGLGRDGRDGGIHKLRFLLYERPDETGENVRDGACKGRGPHADGFRVQPVHSGAMVHPEQFNAIKITARLLNALSKTARRTDFPPWRAAKRKTMRRWRRKTVILCDEPTQ